MPDEDAFRRAIAERPHDPGLKLVFADWLEERGDPLAETVRRVANAGTFLPVSEQAIGPPSQLWIDVMCCLMLLGLGTAGFLFVSVFAFVFGEEALFVMVCTLGVISFGGPLWKVFRWKVLGRPPPELRWQR